MQGIIKALIHEFSERSATREQTGIYLAGILDGMELICKQLEGNKLDLKKEKTDPLFTDNWNYIIDQLTGIIKNTIEEIHNTVPNSTEV